MSNMKDLLGDMTLEEFEVKRKLVLEKFKGKSDDELDEIPFEDIVGHDEMYDMWLEAEGFDFANKRRIEYGGYITTANLDQYAQELWNKYINWLESFN